MSTFEANQRGLNKAMHSGELSLPGSLGGRYLTEQCDSAGRQGEEASKRSPDTMHMVTRSCASRNPEWDSLSHFEAKDYAVTEHRQRQEVFEGENH